MCTICFNTNIVLSEHKRLVAGFQQHWLGLSPKAVQHSWQFSVQLLVSDAIQRRYMKKQSVKRLAVGWTTEVLQFESR
jgi:hypothetical protein